MFELSRTVRLCLNDTDEPVAGGRHNTFSAWPAMRGLGRYYELHVRCIGRPDVVTGYMVNIKDIDAAVREHVLPELHRAVRQGDSAAIAMGELMRRIIARLQSPLNNLVQSVRLQLTPYYSLTLGRHDMGSVLVRQQFEFAAAHRLHVPQLSDDENRRVFGKCNNPSGHGHNYRIEVAVHAAIDDRGQTLAVEKLDELVDRVVIQALDHKNLSIDVPQFKNLNSSVENIAKVIYDMLRDPVKSISAKLDEVSVWETGKTVCTYRADHA